MAISLLATANGDFDLTTAGGIAVYNAAPGNTAACLAKADILLGDGTKNLDGTGGDFNLYITVDSQVVQPSPQTFTFSTDARSKAMTADFIIPASATVAIKVESPNAADTDVDVKTRIYQLDGPVVASSVTGGVTLANGAHGGSSATLTLSSMTVSNAAGDALTISGTGGSAVVMTSNDTGGVIDINSTAASGYAVDISGGSTAGGMKVSSAAASSPSVLILQSNGYTAFQASVIGTAFTTGIPVVNIGSLSEDVSGCTIIVPYYGIMVANADNATVDPVSITTYDHSTSAITGDEGDILGNLSSVAEYPITITPVTSTVSAGEVSETECTAYTDADFSFVFTIVDDSGSAVDLSGKTIDFICEYPDKTDKFIRSTGTEGGVAVSGTDNNIVTVTGAATLTDEEGSYLYAMRNQTDDDILARGTLNILYAPERDAT